MNRRTFLKTGANSTALLFAHPVWAAEKPKPADDEILAQTKTRIEKHRQGDGTIVVRDANGQPVPGAKVNVEQLRHDFLFGANIFKFRRCYNAQLDDLYQQRFAALLNYCTLAFYWASYEAERGKPGYDYTDTVVAWTRKHGITCKGHPLVWDHPAGTPAWLPDDQKEIERLSTSRVSDIVLRYKGRVDVWDVVNEATHLPGNPNKTKMGAWGAAIGPVPYVTKHLKTARAANPQATLLVNDYRTDPPYYKLLEGLQEGGKFLFDIIGIQSHMHGGVWPLHKVWDTCDTYAKLGLPLHFTETTIVSGPRKGPGENWGETTAEDEAKQAEQTIKFYTALFAHPAVQAITWWDLTDLHAWQGAAAGWLRKDMSPKPVYDRLMSLIKGAWWTKTQGVTDSRGELAVRAFFGTHRVAAVLLDGQRLTQEVHWQRGSQNRFELKI